MVNILKIESEFYANNLCSQLNQSFAQHNFTDVTLVSNDQQSFRAHKFVLGTASQVLKDLLTENPHPHPVIYLGNVKRLELEAILQYVYHGETEISASLIEKLFVIAQDLQIHQLIASLIREKNGKEASKDTNGTQNRHEEAQGKIKVESNDEYLESSKANVNLLHKEKEIFHHTFRCKECDISFRGKSGLRYHKRSKHDGIRFFCSYCNFKSTSPGTLKAHKTATHEGVRYACDICDYKASQQGHLKRHKESLHDGVRYNCGECKYSTGWRQKLTRHKQTKHLS